MKSRRVLGCLVVLSILVALLSGCSKRDDAAAVEEEPGAASSVSAVEPEASEASISPTMAQFLGKTVGTQKVTAGHELQELFALWEQVLHHPRVSMEIYFEVDVEGEFQQDHTWENKTHREILDDVCQENDLVWTITAGDTIAIRKKPQP